MRIKGVKTIYTQAINEHINSYSKPSVIKGENQDFTYSDIREDISFVAVADGVSQCENSAYGAEYVCRIIGDAVIEEADYLFGLPPKKAAAVIVRYIRSQLKRLASGHNTDPASYASTLSFICHHKGMKKLMVFNLGDSCIYTVDNGKNIRQLDSVGFTSRFIPVSTMTEGAERETAVEIYDDTDFDSVFLCTDGFWRIMEGSRTNSAELKNAIRNSDMEFVTEFVKATENQDDCTFLHFNINQ